MNHNEATQLQTKRGLSVRNMNLLMAVLTIVFSIMLLFATYRTETEFARLRENTDSYIHWQQDAYALQTASDYLTEQVRCFTETGDRFFLDRYFEENDVTKRREKAIAAIHQYLENSQAGQALQSAMDKSVALMDREYYAMRLTISAHGYDIAQFPEPLQNTVLTEQDARLSSQEQEALARSMVFDETYQQQKKAISDDMRDCLTELAREIDERQNNAENYFQHLLKIQRILIISTIVIALLTMLVTLLLFISPLLRAVMFIRADQPIPITGSNEFQFLAKTYNLMYEARKEQKEQLAFETTHDPLTGIYNRSGYDFFLKNTDWASSALLLFDLDKFKLVNDTYGHDVGDKVLKRAAEALQDSFRSEDHVCRIGGDEFAVIMVHVKSSMEGLIEGKVKRINEALLSPDGDIPQVHVSCGACYGNPDTEISETFRMADAALYRVKKSGGCGCEVCHS